MAREEVLDIFIWYFILISLTVASCNPKNEEKQNTELIIKTELIRTIDTTCDYYMDTVPIRKLIYDVSLINPTDSLKSFWIMTCDSEMNWITNNRTITIYSDHPCNGNFPTQREIRPDDSMVGRFSVVAPPNVREKDIRKLKFGFFFFDASKKNSREEYYKWLDSHNMATEYNTFMQGHHRSKAEIKEWMNEHSRDERNDRRIIWER